MSAFRSFVVKETRHILRDRQTLAVLLALPFVMVLLFGYAIRTDVEGVRTVVVATDNPDGSVIDGLRKERDFNWVYLDFPRAQFKKRGWMEFRKDTDEHVAFSLAAEMELLSTADMLVGNMGSQVSEHA